MNHPFHCERDRAINDHYKTKIQLIQETNDLSHPLAAVIDAERIV